MTALSSIPSVAIQQLKKDLEWAEKHPDLTVDMRYYCDWDITQCRVCLGGAFVYRHLGAAFDVGEVSEELRDAADAGDSLRLGFIGAFLEAINASKFIKYIPIQGSFRMFKTPDEWVTYQQSPEKFHAQLNWLIESFEQLEEMLDD